MTLEEFRAKFHTTSHEEIWILMLNIEYSAYATTLIDDEDKTIFEIE